MNTPVITNSSVRVMRSHDYCHFEVTLGTTDTADLAGVDAMRKEAARLADKAVEQFKIAKENATNCERDSEQREWDRQHIARIEKIPEGERTPDQQAEIKAFLDKAYTAIRRYDYEDDWNEPCDPGDE